MHTAKPAPRLPAGNASALQGISENFAFHASPESFISSRVLRLRREQPEVFDQRAVLRVKLLNRNVAIVSAYDHIRQILLQEGHQRNDGDESNEPTARTEMKPRHVAGLAYDALMAPFFPGPNLLLADGCPHLSMRESWDERMQACQKDEWKLEIKSVITDYCREVLDIYLWSKQPFDVYEAMKTLSWRLLLKLFLNLSPGDQLFEEVQGLQETLLRGQFSLMPVSVNALLWKSARRRGIDAREKLQSVIAKRIEEEGGCPFGTIPEEQILPVTNHVLMMTSSLASKGLASLLMAFSLNLTGFVDNGTPLSTQVRMTRSHDTQQNLLRSICLETERLSPPIVGIMRRTTEESVLENDPEEADILLPKGWDVWLYFVGGARDEKAFGKTNNDLFDPRRYLNGQTPPPLGFGLGPKSCLGQESVRSMELAFAEQISISEGYGFSTDEDLAAGVKGWLGWATATPEEWAADMKQLPTQHPTRPVLVRVTREELR